MTASSSDLMMMRPKDQKLLKALPGNDRCIDCGRMSPEWASVTLSVFVCLECSGVHRSLGTHISFIRSVKMDSWTEQQIASMKAGGGNAKCKEFLETKGGIDMTILETPIPEKYSSPAAELWRQVIKARVNGQEEPTELPEPEVVPDDSQSDAENSTTKKKKKKKFRTSFRKSKTNGSGPPPKVMEGFGSSPHPNELKEQRKRRGKKLLAVGGAAIGVIASVGLAAKTRKNQRKAKKVSKALSQSV